MVHACDLREFCILDSALKLLKYENMSEVFSETILQLELE